MGGQLRVHLDAENGAAKKDGGSGRTWDINPVLDRLVLFRSDLVDHEVHLVAGVRRDTSRDRLACVDIRSV